jgi:hypothetical protein
MYKRKHEALRIKNKARSLKIYTNSHRNQNMAQLKVVKKQKTKRKQGEIKRYWYLQQNIVSGFLLPPKKTT